MSNHKIEYESYRSRGRWLTIAKCSCRKESPERENKQVAEDWALSHEREVARTQALLRPRAATPGVLRSEYDYYRQMQDDPDQTTQAQALWKQMADELEHRLPTRKGDAQPEGQDSLF